MRSGHSYFSANSRDKLLAFVDQYNEGEPFITAANEDAAIFIPETHPEIGDVRLFLQKRFKMLAQKG